MSLDLQLSDLSQLDKIRQALAQNDPRQQFAALGMHDVRISENVLDGLTDLIDSYLARAGRQPGVGAKVRLIVDAATIRRAGADLKDEVFQILAGRYDVRRIVLDDGHAVLHAEQAVLAEAAAAAEGADCVVSVGSGTITDIAKVAAQRSGAPVHVALQTAASVDGFTDNFSVVLTNGVKQTVLSRWPDAVLIDTTTVAEAPQALNAAGVGELLSLFSAPGDWYLASRFGLDDTFSPFLIDVLSLCGAGVEDWSAGVGRGQIDACERLAAALSMRGIVTGVGGTTAALSGMEHLVSHMLDMVRGERGESMGLHGAQVGVGSVIRAAAWEVFCDRMAETPIDPAALFPTPDTLEPQVRAAFASVDPSGRIGEECWSRYSRKLAAWHGARPQVARFFADWDISRAEHDKLVLGTHAMATSLRRAHAPMRYEDLEPAPAEALTRWVVANCQFMRERFTVADLLVFAGWWDADGVSRVLARVEAACAAVPGEGR